MVGGGVSGDMELAETFGEIARTLLAEQDAEAMLRRIVQVSIKLIEPADHAGIDVVDGNLIHAVAPSDEVAERIDGLQVEVNEGPCLSAIREHEVFYSPDLQVETRWPLFAARAYGETGIRSMMGFRLFAQADTFGALDLYSRQPDAFDHETVAMGSVLAAHAGVALATARERAQLHEALRSRDLIGQAKGLLMARGNIDAEEAFDILRRASQRLNVKLRQVAERVIDQDRDIDDGSPPAGAGRGPPV